MAATSLARSSAPEATARTTATRPGASARVRRASASRRPSRAARRPWSRHDLWFAASAALIVALVVVAWVTGAASFTAFPLLSAPVGVAEVALCAAFALVALLPFCDRRGIVR